MAKAKTVQASKSVISVLMRPNDANHLGNVHGGNILKLMDEAAYVCCAKHCQCSCVTVSFDKVEFLKPIHVSDLVTVHARLTFVGKSSMEVEIQVEAMNPQTGVSHKTHSSFVTFVAIDKKGKPVRVPALICETKEEKARFLEGKKRYEERRKMNRKLRSK